MSPRSRRSSSSRKLGRPPAGDSAATRARILQVARRVFADLGYEAATNRLLADRLGLTTAALYHYFPSKSELYVAVHDDVEQTVYGRFAEAIATEATFIGQIEALLDAAYELNCSDASLARFLASMRVDVRRHDDLAKRLRPALRRQARFYQGLIRTGLDTGEIDLADEARVTMLLRTILIGLNDAVSDDVENHLVATDALKALLEGKLLRPASSPIQP